MGIYNLEYDEDRTKRLRRMLGKLKQRKSGLQLAIFNGYDRFMELYSVNESIKDLEYELA